MCVVSLHSLARTQHTVIFPQNWTRVLACTHSYTHTHAHLSLGMVFHRRDADAFPGRPGPLASGKIKTIPCDVTTNGRRANDDEMSNKKSLACSASQRCALVHVLPVTELQYRKLVSALVFVCGVVPAAKTGPCVQEIMARGRTKRTNGCVVHSKRTRLFMIN